MDGHFHYLAELVNQRLDDILKASARADVKLYNAMRYSIFSGGKRIRPIVVLESAASCGGNREEAMPAACAIELVHTYSLIHDDLPAMDDDDYRRGKSTCHRKFDEATAILAGDAMLTLAFEVLARDLSRNAALEAIKELSEAAGARGMVAGQSLDLGSKKSNRHSLGRINGLKTARLFEAAAKLGAIASRAGARKTGAVAKYGYFIGLAFQISDDIIDKDGYAGAIGAEKARAELKKTINHAISSLDVFGRNAANLKLIAEFVLNRVKYGTSHR